MKSKIRSRKKKVNETCSDGNITESLSDLYICNICAIRITSVKKSIDHAFKGFDIDESAEKKTSHCSLCCGILEEFNICEVAKTIASRIDKSKYDAMTFNLGLSIPKFILPQITSMVAYINAQSGCEISHQSLPPMKNVTKFFLLNLVEKFSSKVYDSQSNLFVKLDYNFPSAVKEASSDPKNAKRRKLVDETSKTTASDTASSSIEIDPPPPYSDSFKVDMCVYHLPIYFGGKYKKYSRTPQHSWEDGAAMECLGVKLKELTHGSSLNFISSGREDLDVNILGNGKPFVVEIINPKVTSFTDEDLVNLSNDVNDMETMTVHDLQLVNRAALRMIKKGEEGKQKTYVAKLRSSKAISKKNMQILNQMKDIKISQSTPLRLLHSNPAVLKENTIYEVDLKKTDGSHYDLHIKVSAGTHVKEFVHGDIGRTEPSLKTLLKVPVDVVELDLIDTGIKWPPVLVEDA